MSAEQQRQQRREWWRRRFWDAMIILLVLLIVDSLFWGRDGTLEKGSVAPALELTTLNKGERIHLARREGNPLLLVFWATWCPSCLRELPVADRVARRFAGSGLQALAVTDEQEATSRVSQLIARQGYSLPVAIEGGEVRQAFQVRTIPTTYLLDGAGRVAWAQVGAVSERRLSAAVERVLQGGVSKGS